MSIYGIAPFIGLKMTSFELMKRRYLPSRDHPHFISVNLALGGASAVFATTLTYPSDVLRRKLQVLAFTEDLPYDNLTSCIKHIYKTEGYAGFFRGLVPCYLKVVPSIAILFACNEELKKLLNIV